MFNKFNKRNETDRKPPESGEAEKKLPIGRDEIRKAADTLSKYKSAKAHLEARIIENEQYWKLKQWQSYNEVAKDDMRLASAWLWNTVVSKRADYMDAFPEPNILPRMPDDEAEAQRLTDVIPVVLAQNGFKDVYRDVVTYKLKQGTGVYGVFWDASKHNGIGDIAIRKIDLLRLFWEPGITDIQDSANVFVVDLADNETLKQIYPQLKDKLKANDNIVSKYIYDDTVDTSGKSCVVDWYYKKHDGYRTVLHYCKFVGDEVLYASENDTELPTHFITDEYGELTQQTYGTARSERGWYEHGKYPFVFDTLFDVEGSIAGYGYFDYGKDTQKEIDIINQAIVKNTICGAKPRYFIKENGAVNEKEFADWKNDFIHTNGSLGQDSIRPVDYNSLSGNYISFLELKTDELKEITGNRDVNTGGTGGATAASAIAALQEAGSKQSRDGISKTYEAYKQVIYLVIELMREKYDTMRYFRLQGQDGAMQYVEYSNADLRAQPQYGSNGQDMGLRLPEFDIEVTAEKASEYTKMSQNELALQLYGLGVFSPQNVDQSLMLLDAMDFDGKEDLIQKVSANGTMYDTLMQYQQIALSLAQRYEPQTAAMLAGGIQQSAPQERQASVSVSSNSEDTRMQNARDAAQERSQPR